MLQKINVLELFSGIGGFHAALDSIAADSRLADYEFEVRAAVDINTIANTVYRANFDSQVIEKSVESLSRKFLRSLSVDLLTMSPPCQPFTRIGQKRDIRDNRCDGLQQIIRFLENRTLQPSWILVENVKGFETSDACSLLLESLKNLNYTYSFEFLHPLHFGVPNARFRCYLLASKKTKEILPLESKVKLKRKDDCSLASYLSSAAAEDYFLKPETIDKFLPVMDVVSEKSTHCMCFTKSYSRYFEGTGSLVLVDNENKCERIAGSEEGSSTELKNNLRKSFMSKLRLFTEYEILKLHCFPDEFKFPDSVTRRQRYQLLGNSLNVLVVRELLVHLITS